MRRLSDLVKNCGTPGCSMRMKSQREVLLFAFVFLLADRIANVDMVPLDVFVLFFVRVFAHCSSARIWG
jgi:hypothetical protein